ncbi:flavodoxin [Clostridia bacterium]|nr:flavodoxin [Clostridia bacterium]
MSAVIGINGSPRKGWNTHILVEKALEGAKSEGAEVELVNLYDLSFKGCVSCFECKRKDGPGYGACAVRDDLRPVLEKIAGCDGLIIGSPIYIGEVTASTRAFFERLTFQYITYSRDTRSFFKGQIPTVSIYTMNVPESALDEIGYSEKFRFYEERYEHVFGAPSKTLVSTETWQTEDYGKYHMSMFDGGARKKRREEVFPKDCEKAFALGAELAGGKNREAN